MERNDSRIYYELDNIPYFLILCTRDILCGSGILLEILAVDRTDSLIRTNAP